MAIPPDTSQVPPILGWLWSPISGLFGGLLAYANFNGSTKATLSAHDQRLTTLEGDIRYEIRTLRESVERVLTLLVEKKP